MGNATKAIKESVTSIQKAVGNLVYSMGRAVKNTIVTAATVI